MYNRDASIYLEFRYIVSMSLYLIVFDYSYRRRIGRFNIDFLDYRHAQLLFLRTEFIVLGNVTR